MPSPVPLMKIITVFLFTLLIGCADNKSKSVFHTLDFGAFSIETPSSWTKIKARGLDSYVGRIAVDDTDTLDFDLGWYSNTLTESEPQIFERSMLSDLDGLDTSEVIIVESRRNIDTDNYKKNNVSWDSIDGRKAKIVFPRKSGIGTTGIYIDSLWHAGSEIV